MILVTGAAGFIGFHVAQRLLRDGEAVVGLDNVNGYYDPALKEARLKLLLSNPRFTFIRGDIADAGTVAAAFAAHRPGRVVHLAAQAGVRHSITNPRAYVESNLAGFLNILEGCREGKVAHLVYASSSSVYGLNEATPFSAAGKADHPVSLYGATKKANELMAHAYSHLYRIPTTGIRLFTVYGPWGRPDMAYFLFTRSIIEGKPIDVYNEGRMKRDFTYIDDVVEGIVRVLALPASPDPDWRGTDPDSSSSTAPYRIYNIGNHTPIELGRFIAIVEDCVGKKAIRNLLPAQPGDVISTAADVEALAKAVGFAPSTPIEVGIRRFVEWYRGHYGV
jgi:UDP-glucuronate 4-epimerase